MTLRIFCVFLMFLSLSTWGKTIEGLYDAKIIVTNQSAKVRKEAAQEALKDVLLRVSGMQWQEPNVQIDRALSIADQYLYQFSYSQLEADEWSTKTPPGSSWLNMKFESKAIERVLKRAGLPLWGANRPTLLLWLAVDDGNGRREVIREGSKHAALAGVQAAAKKRGIPVILPIYDLEDSMQLPVESLWGLFSDAIQEASVRYSAESVLAGRLYKGNGNKWFASWKFYFRGKERNFIDHTDSMSGHLLQGISQSAEVLANAFAIKPNAVATGAVRLSVMGVNDLSQYADVTRYLEKMSVVKTVTVDGIENNVLDLTLKLVAQYAQFEQAIKLDKKLIAIEPVASQTSVDVILDGPEARKQFRWRP